MSHTLDLNKIKKIWEYKDDDDNYSEPFTVCVEGNIGSGKTTLLDYFSKNESIGILSEPVECWRNCRGVNLLEKMYNDPYRWAMPFQTYVIISMKQNHLKKIYKPIKLMERSIFSSNFCFIKTMKTFDTIDQGMYNIFNEWLDIYKSQIKVDAFIYVQTDPEICMQRIEERNRAEEQSTITLDYLNALHEAHELWLNDNNTKNNNVPIYKLNGNLNKDAIHVEYQLLEKKIMSMSNMNSDNNELESI